MPTDVIDSDLAASDSTQDVLIDAAAAQSTGPKAPLRNMEDLRRLNRRATQQGMYAGMFGGAAMAFAASRFGVRKNGLVITFLLGSTGISYFTTRSVIRSVLSEQHERIAERAHTGADGSVYLPDPAGEVVESWGSAGSAGSGSGSGSGLGSRVSLSEVQARQQQQADAMLYPNSKMPELQNLGRSPPPRTRYTKGHGLEGEVEEEGEMRDTFFRPGVPRREV